MLQFYNRIVNYLFPKSNNSTLLFPAIYGIRAIAIIFILLSAFNFQFVSDGNLGYSVLFVVSGYLFTESIMKGIERENRLKLGKFYKNRALKIFPSLIAMLLITSILIAVFRRELMSVFRLHFLPGLFQFENWWQIFKYDNALVELNPIKHLWALSLLVQLAIIWSLIVWGIYRFTREEKLPMIVAGVIAIFSMILMFIFYSPEHPAHGTLGTDTRCFSFFIGAALACYTGNPRDRIWEYPVFIVDILGGISLLGLIAILIFGGMTKTIFVVFNALASVFTACILLSAFRPSSVLARILGFAPLSLIGKASYGIFLWHIPFIMLFKLENGGKWWVMLIAIIVIAIFAALTTRFIEGPIRRSVIEDTYRIIDGTPTSTYEKQEYRRALKRARIGLLSVFAVLMLALICMLAVQGGSGENNPAEEAQGESSEGEDGQGEEGSASNLPKDFEDTNTLFIGDGYALNVHDTLIDNIPHITVDIAGSRYSNSVGPIYEAYASGGWEGDIVIISMSSEGEMFDSLEDLRGRMKEEQLLFVINNRGSDWEQANNSKIADFVNVNEATFAVDWYGASENHPEYFDSENGGLSQEGANAYMELIQLTVKAVLNS